MPVCSVHDCIRTAKTKGMCNTCYERGRRQSAAMDEVRSLAKPKPKSQAGNVSTDAASVVTSPVGSPKKRPGSVFDAAVKAAKADATPENPVGMVVVEEAAVRALGESLLVTADSTPAAVLRHAAEALAQKLKNDRASSAFRDGVVAALGHDPDTYAVDDTQLLVELRAFTDRDRAEFEELQLVNARVEDLDGRDVLTRVSNLRRAHDKWKHDVAMLREGLDIIGEQLSVQFMRQLNDKAAINRVNEAVAGLANLAGEVKKRLDRDYVSLARSEDLLLARVEEAVNRAVELRRIVESINKSMLNGVLVVVGDSAAIDDKRIDRVDSQLILLETIIDNVMPKGWQGDLDEVAGRIGDLVRSNPAAGMALVQEAHVRLLAETLALPDDVPSAELLYAAASALSARSADLLDAKANRQVIIELMRNVVGVQADPSDVELRQSMERLCTELATRQRWADGLYDRIVQVGNLLEVAVSEEGASLLSVLEVERLKIGEAVKRIDSIRADLS